MAVPATTFAKLYGLDIDIDVTCRSSIQSITCPTHPSKLVVVLGEQPKNENSKTGKATLSDITMDRDVVVLIKEQDCHQPRACLEVSPQDGTLTGFVTFYPQIEFADTQNQEFIFVVDRSGSMSGSKMVQARKALLLFLRSSPVMCTFNVISFGSRFEALFPTPQPYNDETLQQATELATGMEANLGGTEILRPLERILSHTTDRDRQIFVLTDGQVSNDLQVFDLIRKHCQQPRQNSVSSLLGSEARRTEKNRLFSVGIGLGVSRHLVSGMA